MHKLRRVLQLIGVNSVPVGGVFFGGWSTSTALVLYWCENLALVLLVALRIALHRRLTGKRGHQLAHIESSRLASKTARVAPRSTSYLSEFLSVGIVFTLAHGLFLAAIVFLLFPQEYPEAGGVDWHELGVGFAILLALLLLGLAFDLVGLADRSFAWIKTLADRVVGRVVIVHLTIILGLWAMMGMDAPLGMFLVFAGLKLLVDLGSLIPKPEVSDKPPGCLRVFSPAFRKKGTSVDAAWSEIIAETKHREEEYERT